MIKNHISNRKLAYPVGLNAVQKNHTEIILDCNCDTSPRFEWE